MSDDCRYRQDNETYAAPRPLAGVFDSPTVRICLNTEWASHVDGLLERLLCPNYWQGTDTEVDATIQQVGELLIKLAEIQECQRVHYIGEPFSKFTSTAPAGALPMDGAPRLQADYPALMAEIPSSWKSGDYFTLPDMAGRDLVGQGFYYKRPDGVTDLATVGYVGGEQEHTLTSAEMPIHNHNRNTSGMAEYSLRYGASGAYGFGSGSAPALSNLTKTGNSGGDASHNNMPPFLTAYWFIQAV